MPTIGVDFKLKTIQSHNKVIKLQIWDTAGQERFQAITTSYYRGSHGIIFIYDVTDKESFRDILSRWKKQVETIRLDGTRFLLVGTKNDLEAEREVSFAEGQELADALGCQFVETSAKEGSNVREAFEGMAWEL